jgi:hypothetical protein
LSAVALKRVAAAGRAAAAAARVEGQEPFHLEEQALVAVDQLPKETTTQRQPRK